MEISYRPGKKEDSNEIAEMVNIASDGVIEYLFHELVPGLTPVQVLAHGLENDYYPHTYKSSIVACEGNKLVGMALSFPSSFHGITDKMKGFFPPERLAHFNDFYSSRVENTWFLDALCVLKNYQRRSIGKKLISLTKEKAAKNGYKALTLMVFADNELAIPVYECTGFKVVQKVDLQENEFIKHKQGCLLMQCKIQG